MLSATKAYFCTAFKTWAGLEKLDGVPSNLPKLPNSSDSIEIKKAFIEKHIGKFVDEFVLVEIDVEKAWMEGIEERGQQQVVQQQARAVQQGVERGVQRGMQQGVQRGVQRGVQQGVQRGVQRGVQQGVQQGVHQGVQQGVQRGVQQGLQWAVQQGVQQRVQLGVQRQRGQAQTDTSVHHSNALDPSALQTSDVHTSSSSHWDDITVGMFTYFAVGVVWLLCNAFICNWSFIIIT